MVCLVTSARTTCPDEVSPSWGHVPKSGNNIALLSDIITAKAERGAIDIEYRTGAAHLGDMTHARLIPATIAALMLLTSPAVAGCFADYKARKDNPLQLHYGVMEITGTCTRAAAQAQAQARLAAQGWRLLNVVSVFDDAGLSSRRSVAGDYFLRF